MRGGEGDLQAQIDLGDEAFALWVPGTRRVDLAEHHHHAANANYWVGQYEKVLEHGKSEADLASDPNSVELRLRGAGMQGLALTALGRYEEAFQLFESAIAVGRDLGRPVRVLLNYSTMAYRDVFDFAEARRRNEEALEQSGWSGFEMPRLNSVVDILFADLLSGDVGKADQEWPSFWEDVQQGKAWERWLLTGKMIAARAEIELRSHRLDEAVEWANRAVDLAKRVGRRKYESAARVTLGEALLAQGKAAEAVGELRAAVALADELGSPSGTWRARAALGKSLDATGDDDAAEAVYREAAQIINAMAATLSPVHQRSFLDAATVQETLKAGS
jgi:tetratricopeptide (TPR) repeat protein